MDLALFDFDGTITNRETMPDFMYASVRPGRLLIGKFLLLPLIVGYKAKLVSGVTVRAAICYVGFRGVPMQEVEAHGQRFAEQFLPTTLRAEAMARMSWHKARGDTVVVVSGGLDIYLRAWCHAQGVELLCSALEHRNGKLTGRYSGKQCVREEKARVVEQRYPRNRFDRIFAYGDTPEDFALLALADEPFYQHWPRTE